MRACCHQRLLAKGDVEQRMPLARYFYFVGGVLLALLFILDACIPKPRGLGEGNSLSARHSDLFRSEMAGAHRLRYQPPDDRPDFDCHYRRYHPGARNHRRGFNRCEGTGVLCDAATFRRDQLQASNTRMRELKPRHHVKIARKRTVTSRFAMARHPQVGQFGWFGRTFW